MRSEKHPKHFVRGLLMFRTMTWAILIGFLAAGCKTAGVNSDIKLNDTDVQQIKSGDLTCYGDRKFIGTDLQSFDFKATNSSLSNAYWLSIASAAVYGSSVINKALLTVLANSSLTGFQFFGEEPKDRRTKGYMAEFKEGTIIAYRGTNEAVDFLTNIDRFRFSGKAFNRDGKLEELEIHRGFWLASEPSWDPILKTVLKNAPIVQLPVDSNEAFLQVNRIFRSIMQEADIESYNPNDFFKLEIKKLQDRGIIKTNAKLADLLGVLNIWAEEAKLASIAYTDSVKSNEFKTYRTVLEKGMVRKKNNFARVHPFFNYRSYKPIWLTGHSLGASLSTVQAYRLIKHGIPVQGLVTFGSPRSGNDVYEYFFESSMIEDGRILNLMRFQNDNDGVTRVPHFNGWRHVGDPWFIDKDKRLFIPSPAAENKAALEKQIGLYPVAKVVTYFSDEVPPGYKGIWTFDVLQFVGDHAMEASYIGPIENFVFGKRALGCK
jgi:hypothetical protein